MDRLEFTAPMPPARLRGNRQGGDLRARNRAKHEYQRTVAVLARAASGLDLPRFHMARVTLTFVLPDYRRRDYDNHITGWKGGQDALSALGLLHDDDMLHIVSLTCRREFQRGCEPSVRVLIERADDPCPLHSSDVPALAQEHEP